MDCSEARSWISARIDGEPVDDPAAVEAHQRGCPACAEFEAQSHYLKRTMAFRPVRHEPLDLAPLVLARAGAPNLGAGEWKRVLLGATGITLLLLAIPGVLFGSSIFGTELGASDHSGRHVGAFAAALAFGFAFAGWRPERAIGLVPFTTALGGLIILTGAIDTIRGSATGLAEASHFLELFGVGLVWEISGGRARLGSWVARLAPG
ncbi:MAG: hypothetical protein HKN24_08030 [Acidimicrobiales bacterium]|nr:hypothetical protein [Acidimicrobiales bacterium]